MKRLLSFFIVLSLIGSAFAQRLTEQEAKERALAFLQSKQGNVQTRNAGIKSTTLSPVSLGIDGVYVFNVDGGGYVVAGGDARVLPVLGYGDNGALSAEAIPSNMKAWLEGYARQAAFASEHNLDCSLKAVTADHEPIEPMVKSKWGQERPYNLMTPFANKNATSGANCPTGCVATAMAQVVNYYKWPEKAEGIGTARDHFNQNYQIDMSNDYFDWDNILDIYTNEKSEVIAGNETQWNAVALLMRDIGYSVKSKYRSESTGSKSYNIPFALVNNFGFDKGAHMDYRNWYTDEQWDSLIYDNLSKYGPVIYSGVTKAQEGHEFVCDGYRGDGYYHFNWGWDGLSDGYFLLSSLSPEHQGLGGSMDILAFDYNQDAVFGVCKPREGSKAVLNISQNEDLLSYEGKMSGLINILVSVEEDVDFGLWTKDLTTGEETFRYGETKHIDAPAMLEELPINCEVPDGKYKVKPIYRRSGESEWRFFRVGQSIRDYVMLTVVDGVQIYDIDVPFKYNEVQLGKTCVLLNKESYANLAVRGNGAYHEADISYKLIDEQTGDVLMEGEHTKVSLSMNLKNVELVLKASNIDLAHTYKLQVFDADSLLVEQAGIKAFDTPYLEEIQPLTIVEAVDGELYRNLEDIVVKFEYKVIGDCPVDNVSLDFNSIWEGSSVIDEYLIINDNVYSFEKHYAPSDFDLEDAEELELAIKFKYGGKNIMRLKDGSEIKLKVMVVDDAPSGIDGITINDRAKRERIYDLRGIEMKSEKGIYIKGGKVRIKN